MKAESIAKESIEKLEWKGMLFDFYGELLTEHQKKIYENAIFDDLSLSEIASEQGISRQGVHDLIKRCDKLLAGYEEKLHLVERFLSVKEKVHQIDGLLAEAEENQLIQKIRKISSEIIEEL